MKAKQLQRFDVDALLDLAGPQSFERGQAYFDDGHVTIVSIGPQRVVAQVAGTEDYRTELTGRGDEIDGECSCPAFEDQGFCKHMVAVALAANTAGPQAETEGAGALARIRQHLKKMGTDALVAMIVDLAEQDPALFHKLDVAATIAQADDATIEARLCKTIDGATSTKRFVDYREAPHWAAGVNEALDAVADLASNGRPGLGLKLTEQAIDRIEQAIEGIDDSDGHCGALLERARDIHLAAALAARPEPVQLARNLFTRETEGDYDTFHSAAEVYADALGEPGLAEYRRLATEAWDKLPGRKRGADRDEPAHEPYRLIGILDFFAERDGNVEQRIALRSKDLSSQWSYLQLAEFCLAQGRKEEALRRAEEGLWLFEDDRPDQRLVFFTADLLAKAGRGKDALPHLWRIFEKAPSLEVFTRLRKLGGTPARERALNFLERSQPARDARPLWAGSADLLITILIREKMLDRAWAAARKHGASPAVNQALAGASETSHPSATLEVYCGRVEQLANVGGDPAYTEAARLVARMAALRSAAEQTAYVAALKDRFHRRRNFVKLLA